MTNRHMIVRAMMAAATGMLALLVALPASPALAQPSAKAPRPGQSITVAIDAPDLVRLDRQSSQPAQVVFTGVDNRSRVRVGYGDGTLRSAKGSCSVRKAARTPERCRVRFPVSYDRTGTFTITARGGRAAADHVITVADVPGRWHPEPGQVFNQGWAPLSVTQRMGATFTFCQAVPWYFDRSGETPDRSTMIDDLRQGLATLAAQTGLRFEEVTDPKTAAVTFSWADLTDHGQYVAGLGGPAGLGKGLVRFSSTSEWTKDFYAGSQPVHHEWVEGNWRYWYDLQGRQALVIHETMHVLGFDHVDDYTSIMYPQSIGNGAGQLSAGDIAGLHAMYLDHPCPLIPG
ncbi:MAG: matrixin family metalloprotease [Actinomycetales bacterium]|nr:matrixin family metalloprotease [Actinomycetales bacterium]